MRRALAGLVGLLVSGLALLFTFAHVHVEGGLSIVPRYHWASLEAAFTSAHPLWLAAFALLNLSSLVPRALQIRALTSRRDGRPPGALASWHATSVAMLAQNVLPARLGDAARVVALTRADDVPAASAIAGVALERALDLSSLLLFACMPGLLIARAGTPVGHALRLFLLIGGAAWLGIAGLFIGLRREGLVRLGRRLRPSIGRALAGFAAGLDVLGRPGRRASAILSSLVVPLWMAAGFACSLQAFGLGGLPLGSSLLLTSAVLLAAAIPSAPSSLGVYHAAVIWLLRGLGASPAASVALAISTHAIGALLYIGVGLISFVHLGALTSPPPSATDPTCAA